MDVSYCRWNLHKFIVDDGTDPIPVWRKDGKMKETKVRRGCVVRSLLVMYIISGLLLVLLALIVSRVEKEDAVAQVGVIVIYVLSCGIGGFVLGKWKKRQKFLWGLLVGILYVATLLGAALWIQRAAPSRVATYKIPTKSPHKNFCLFFHFPRTKPPIPQEST